MILGLALGALLVLGGGASAEPPQRLASPLTDTVGALDAAEVAAAQADLQSAQGIQLWVAYVDSFDGLSGQAWADRTAELSGLGGNDLLFTVAVGDRAYGYSAGPTVDDAELERVIATQVEPELAASDWTGAVVALADGLSGGGSSLMPWLIGGAALVGVALLAVVLARRRQAGGGAPQGGTAGQPAPEPIEELRQRAAGALIDADDSIKTSEQELGFAIAQFGDEVAAPFTAALEESKKELGEAFAVQRQVQDATDTPQERELLGRIISLCQSADDRLDEHVEDFDRMRDLERTIDTVVVDLRTRLADLTGRLDSAHGTAQRLDEQYPPEALASMRANLEQAGERIEFAGQSLDTGDQLLGQGDRSGAVAHARATEEALAQVATLLDAVERAPAELDQAKQAITALLDETARDVAEASRLLAAGTTAAGPGLAQAHDYAAKTLAWAQQVVGTGRFDPLAARRALAESDEALEAALEPVRAEEQRRQRAAGLLASTTDAARAAIRAADDYITTRRGAVGADARTRLAQAQREFAAATATQDPTAALTQLQRADQLADQALALAQRDEARYRDRSRRAGSPDLGGVVLGGILLDSMMRGGRRGGFPGGGGGRRGPGSFGGGATRGRRSGGGRF